MKGNFAFYGIKSPERKKLAKSIWKEHSYPEILQAIKIVKQFWELPQRELQYCGIELMEKLHKQWQPEIIYFFEYLITHKSWWDSVDAIASHLVGGYFLKFQHNKQEIINRWCDSGHLWLQRTSIIFQLQYKEKTDEKLLFANIRKHSSSNEFFLQKAIGWALRQYARIKPETVVRFVKHNDLKPLSYREAVKHLKDYTI